MAIGAQSNQILFAVVSQVTSGLDVMNLQVPFALYRTGTARAARLPGLALHLLDFRLGSRPNRRVRFLAENTLSCYTLAPRFDQR